MVMASTGRITVQLTALKGTATPAALATAVTLPTTITYSAGSQLHVRMQVTGTNPTTVRLKVWPATRPNRRRGSRPPPTPSRRCRAPARSGLTTYLSGSVTNAPVVVRMTRSQPGRSPDVLRAPAVVDGEGVRDRSSALLVAPAGFEPAAHGLGNRCSIP